MFACCLHRVQDGEKRQASGVRWSQFLCVTWILGTAPYVQIRIYSSLGEGERWQKTFPLSISRIPAARGTSASLYF